jgi:arsenate reductase
MKRILFVCVHNSGRSQMAEAFLNQMAQDKAIGYSAGTSPAGEVNPIVIQAMEEIGISMKDHRPKPLTPDILQDVDLVITMGCGAEGVCPASFVQTDDWNLEDPKDKSIEEVRKIRDEIKRRVAILVKDLK